MSLMSPALAGGFFTTWEAPSSTGAVFSFLQDAAMLFFPEIQGNDS